jgi:two-component system, chemotaxis family, chemotaxis protein CheY
MAKVVIIEDALLMRKMLRNLIIQAGHEVVGEAEDGYQGIQEYLNHNPDLILLDIIMPKMDGIKTLKILISHNPDIKVIIVSSVESLKMIKHAIKNGAKGYVMKPFNGSVLIKEINKVLGSNLT